MRVLSVAVPVPFLDALSYRLPDHWDVPAIGARVRVPVGPRIVTGCVVGIRDENQPGDASMGADLKVRPYDSPFRRGGPSGPPDSPALKDIAEILDTDSFVPPTVVALCQWVADYYAAGIGDVIAAAMPPRAHVRTSGFKTRRVAALTAEGIAVLAGHAGPSANDAAFRARRADPVAITITAKQRMALELLASRPAGFPVITLRERGVSAALVSRLMSHGLVAVTSEADERDPFARAALPSVDIDTTRRLTDEQAAAFTTLTTLAGDGFKVALLHGVTGSGKTEIYLRLADHVRRAGRQVLLLVPEIALTPSVSAIFRGVFGDRVAIQHSGLSDGERHDQWQRIRRHDVDIVVGTRSAVFAPLDDVGLVIVDEEHDSSYKQEETPRYHGRDVAIVRAQQAGALIVLGSATPSMETYQNVATGKYATAVLARRVLDRPLADVRLVNMREEYADQGPDVVISRALSTAIEDRLGRREQVIVLLNRRGYATAVFCRQCGDSFDCPNCSISLTVHTARHGWRARCHYCNHTVTVPTTCRTCAAPYLEQAGFGTEKVEQQLRDRFPDARIERIDRDSVRKKGSLTSLLARFGAGEIDVIVGTQMIAKGHDFPRVTLVGVISADVGLGLADFRAAERTFQLLTQVAGRAGRGERPGEAIVQTLYPEHYSIQLARRQDYGEFFTRELGFRRMMRYPPMVAMINVVVRGRTFEEAMQAASGVVQRLEPAATACRFVLLGPAPAPLARLRGEHRVQFFLKGTRRAEMRQALLAVLKEMPELRRRVIVDVDPLSMM